MAVEPTVTWKEWEPSDGKRKSCSAPGCKNGVEFVKTITRLNGDVVKRRRYMYCADDTPTEVTAS